MQTKFPLRSSDDGRYLEEADGKPFFYQADTAWMLPLRRTVDEADEYFAIKKAQGFNAIQLQLTGFLGAKNFEGRLPFGEKHDFTAPDERYFAQVDAIFERALARNLYLAVAPLWSGCCGEGWAGTERDGTPKPMNAQGPDACNAFGKWLGQRYAKYPNLMWILGGDNDPWNAYEEIVALAEGLREAAPHQLRTYHAASTHSSTDVFPDADWLDVSMTYTYFRGFNKAWNKVQPDVYEVNMTEGWKKLRKPYFLGESTYEREHGEWGSPLQVRKQAWWSALSGATGHAYGSLNWKMEDDWRELADLPGARSLKHLTDLLTERPWESFLGRSIRFEDDPFGSNNYAAAATASNKSFGVGYCPSSRPYSFSGVWNRSYLYDPTSGRKMPLENNRGITPERNDAGDTDMVIVLEYDSCSPLAEKRR